MRLSPWLIAFGALAWASGMPADAAPPVKDPPTTVTPLTLSVERLVEDPALSGAAPRLLKLSPDGRHVSFLRGKDSDQNVFDLWEYHVPSAETRLLVDSAALTGGATEVLSDEEKARRERLRIAGTSGIVEYQWSEDGRRLMFPIAGALFVYHLDAEEGDEVKQLTRAEDGFATDPKFSPKGRYVSFVRERSLYAIEIATGKELALSPKGEGTISYGMAEFVAQEEMDRLSGYWWAKDDSAVAYARVDEAPVAIEKRLEIYPDRAEIIEQRYPAAGKANADVRLFVRTLKAKAPVEIDLGPERDIYLARVDWLPDSRALFVQRQSRDQRTLDLLEADARTGATHVTLSEHSETWINLHHDLNVLDDGKSFIWASERSGYQHLELRARDGRLLHALTHGDWVVDSLLAVDEKRGLYYFDANADDAREKQIYVGALAGGKTAARRLSTQPGWHDAVFAKDASVYADSFSDENTPPQVRLHNAAGKEVAVLEANPVVPGHPYHAFRAAHRQPEYGVLAASDGQRLLYRVIKPLGFIEGKRYPVVVRVYGGPHVQYVQRRWDERWGLFDQLLAQRGFVVFSLDNRGSARRGVKFEAPIHRAMGGPEVDDQMVGIRWLAAQPYVDPKRIASFGWSYGGYMTTLLLAKHSDEIAAGVAVAPVTDWDLYDTHYTERYMDDPKAHPQAYAQSGVYAHLAGLTSKLFLVHGMADDNVLFTNSTRLMAALQNQGTQFDLMTYPGGKHGLAGPPTRKHVFNAIVKWLGEATR